MLGVQARGWEPGRICTQPPPQGRRMEGRLPCAHGHAPVEVEALGCQELQAARLAHKALVLPLKGAREYPEVVSAGHVRVGTCRWRGGGACVRACN